MPSAWTVTVLPDDRVTGVSSTTSAPLMRVRFSTPSPASLSLASTSSAVLVGPTVKVSSLASGGSALTGRMVTFTEPSAVSPSSLVIR